MRFIKSLFLIIIVILTCFICSCNQSKEPFSSKELLQSEELWNIEISVAEPLIELASNIYSEAQLSEILNFNGSIIELNEKYPIECLRKVLDYYKGGVYPEKYREIVYRVSYLGDESSVSLIFDSTGKKIFGEIDRLKCSKSDFDNIKIGDNVQDVKAIDPEGLYFLLHASNPAYSRMSWHQTKEGYWIKFEYDSFDRVMTITEGLF